MTKLETLVVPVELGKWLQYRRIGHSGAYFTTIGALFHYWETVVGSPTGDFIYQNKKELIEVIIGSREYKVEEPLYYALIKGHDVSGDYYVYWNCDKFNNDVIVSRLHPPHDDFSTELSKSEWNELGINDSNAEFVRVEENE